MTTGIKHRLLGITTCIWQGHQPVPGFVVIYGTVYSCTCCARCHKRL